MSTIDPRVARMQSYDTVFTGAVAGWLAAFLAALHVLVWVVAALAAGATLDVVRSLVIETGEREGTFELLAGWPFLVLVVLALIAGAGVHGAATRVTSEAAASALRFATAAVGLSIGLVAFASRWTPPQVVGTRTEYFGTQARDWGLLEWLAYWAPVWLPALAGAVAIVTTVMSASLIVRRIHSQERTEEVLRNGIHVSGHVSHVRAGEDDGKGRCQVRFTVTYLDRTGQRRWVEKTAEMYTDEVPEIDGPAEIWYDGERLNDTGRMAIDVAVIRGPRADRVAKEKDES